MSTPKYTIFIILFLLSAPLLAVDANQNKSQGQLLYENHCGKCHDSRVHIRENHKSKSVDDIRYWVTRWSSHLKLEWTASEVDAVADFLANKYYKFRATQ